MENDVILQISSRLKDIRLENKITLQQLADNANVTKGLLSQIENNRTVPSLSVLINIITALNVDLNEFFSTLSNPPRKGPLIIKKTAYQEFKKETSKGCFYSRIASLEINGKLVDIILYKQEKNAKKKIAFTNGYEYNYMLQGMVEYRIDGKQYILEEGDSFYYDASVPHLSKCLSENSFTMLVIYFFN